ncbi:MAG: methyltransferase, TIGR04325 family, partial [Vicinamibacterales bacterium]
LGCFMTPFQSSSARSAAVAIRFDGNYRTWAEAQRASTGYDAQGILERTLAAVLKVKKGEAAYERDSVVFPEIEYSFPLLAALLLAAATEKRLSVLDFGGSLGSSYFQNRHLLRGVADLKWGIVEQAEVVACGRRHVAEGALQFFADAEDCLRQTSPNFVLLSGVLSYVPEPLSLLRQLVSHRPSFICLDRTLVAVRGATRLTAQFVPSQIYEASYPCWIVKEAELLAPFADTYRRVYAFDALGGGVSLQGLTGAFKGYLFARADVARTLGVA